MMQSFRNRKIYILLKEELAPISVASQDESATTGYLFDDKSNATEPVLNI